VNELLYVLVKYLHESLEMKSEQVNAVVLEQLHFEHEELLVEHEVVPDYVV
jgi:hypothetical protein